MPAIVPGPLLRARRTGGILAALGAVLTLALGVPTHGGRTGSAFDVAVRSGVDGAVPGAVLRVLVLPAEPGVLLGLGGVIVAISLLRRRFTAVLLAVAGPGIAVALNTFVLKPVFARRFTDYLAYPSGHTVSLVAVLTVLVLLCGTTRRALLCGVAVALVATCCAAVALVGLGYHYITDVFGGIGFAIAVVIALALVLDRLRGPATPAGTPRADTSSGTRPPASPR